ncbi:MAG: hypothetical protein WKF57_11895 [Nakamurella sp.]
MTARVAVSGSSIVGGLGDSRQLAVSFTAAVAAQSKMRALNLLPIEGVSERQMYLPLLTPAPVRPASLT